MQDPRPMNIVSPAGSLHLRSPTISDAKAIRAIDLNQANTLHQEHINEQENTLESVRARLAQWTDPATVPDFLMLVVTPADSARVIGYCGFSEYSLNATEVEAGCMIDSSASGRGYGTECYGAMFEYAFRDVLDGGLGMQTVKASTAEDNGPMRAVLEGKSGFAGGMGRDPFGPCLVYRLIKDEWARHERNSNSVK